MLSDAKIDDIIFFLYFFKVSEFMSCKSLVFGFNIPVQSLQLSKVEHEWVGG